MPLSWSSWGVWTAPAHISTSPRGLSSAAQNTHSVSSGERKEGKREGLPVDRCSALLWRLSNRPDIPGNLQTAIFNCSLPKKGGGGGGGGCGLPQQIWLICNSDRSSRPCKIM